MFISGKRSIPVPLVWMYQRMRVLHRRSGGSTDRAHNVVLLTKNEIDIRRMELEATESRSINRSLEVRVGGEAAELGTLASIHNRVCWQGNRIVVHWGIYLLSKGREPWVIDPDVMYSDGYVRRPLLIK